MASRERELAEPMPSFSRRTRAELEYRRGTPTAVREFRLVARLWKRTPHPLQSSMVGNFAPTASPGREMGPIEFWDTMGYDGS